MYTLTTTIIERDDVVSILFYRCNGAAYQVTFTDCESIYTFTGKYSGGETIGGKLYKFKKGGSIGLIGNASMHCSVMNAVLSLWNNHIKEIVEK